METSPLSLKQKQSPGEEGPPSPVLEFPLCACQQVPGDAAGRRFLPFQEQVVPHLCGDSPHWYRTQPEMDGMCMCKLR